MIKMHCGKCKSEVEIDIYAGEVINGVFQARYACSKCNKTLAKFSMQDKTPSDKNDADWWKK